MINSVNPECRKSFIFKIFIIVIATIAMMYPHNLSRLWGSMILTPVMYAILNDLRACRTCIEYFTLGHIYDAPRLVMNLNPNQNAIIWGIFVAAKLSLFGSSFATAFAAIRNFPNFDEIPVISILLIQSTVYIVIFVLGELVSWCSLFNSANYYSEYFDKECHVPRKLMGKWNAVMNRNVMGYFLIMIWWSLLLSVSVNVKLTT
jgi:hypothetical protein